MSNVIDWIVSLMNTLGAPGVGIAIFLENLFPPIPSEVVLPLAGFTVSQGELHFVSALVWSTLGSVVGASVLYWVGAAVGAERLRKIADWMWLTEPDDVDKALAFFDKYGTASIFFGRFVPGVRSLISIPAGVHRTGLLRFGLWTAAGSLIWNAALIGLGVYLGDQYHLVAGVIDQYSTVIYVLIAALLVAFLVYAVRREIRAKRKRTARQATANTVDSADTTR